MTHYICSLSPWHFVPLSFGLPNFQLSRSDPAHNPQWLSFVKAHGLVARGADARVTAEQSGANLWLLKPTNGSGGEGIAISCQLEELEKAMASAKASTQGFVRLRKPTPRLSLSPESCACALSPHLHSAM